MKKIIAVLLCGLFISMGMPVMAEIPDCNCGDGGDIVSVEHMALPKKLEKKAPTTIVNVSDEEITVLPYNVIPLTFAQAFNSKNACVGDEIEFILNEPLKTEECTEILPAGTKFVAEIWKIEKPKMFNRSGKVYINFTHIELPCGTQKTVYAKVFSKKDFLSRGKLNALGKGLGSTLGGMAVGTGAGCGIGIAAGSVIVGGFAIGMPIGFAVGATAGLVTPGLYYKAKAGDKINIQLMDKIILDNE